MYLVFIEYKGKVLKKKLYDNCEGLKIVYILLTDKNIRNHYNYHFVCDIKTGNVIIPSTSCESGFKESSYIHLNFKNSKFDIPIHSIYTLGQDLPTNLNFNVDVNI